MLKRAASGLVLLLVGGVAFAGSVASGAGEDALDFNSWKPWALIISALASACGLVLAVKQAFVDPKGATAKQVAVEATQIKTAVGRADDAARAEGAKTRVASKAEHELTRDEIAEVKAAMKELLDRAQAEGRTLGEGEAQSIAEAVRAIFASNDARKKPVQDALEEGRLEEAASRLMGLGEQGAAAADDFQRTAAEDFREAGALYLAFDTAKAIAAFEKARERDPNHCWTQVELARLYLRAGRSQESMEAAERAEACADDERDRSAAFEAQADGFVVAGNGIRALERYQAMSDILRRLVEINPDSASAKRDVSVSLTKVGDVLFSQGRGEDALARYQEGLEIARALSAQDPGSASAKRDVSVSLTKVGDVLFSQGRGEDALARYQESLEIRRGLSAQDAGSASAKRDVSVSLTKVGDVLFSQGRGEDALARYQESLEIRRGLSAQDPDSAEASRDVSVSLNKVGEVLVSQGRGDDALARYQESLEIRRALSAQDPGSASAKRDVSVSLNNVGDVLVSQGRVEDALVLYQESLEIRRTLSAQDPGSALAKRDVSVSLNNVGDVLVSQGRGEDALARYQEGLEVARALSAQDPGSASAKRDVWVGLWRMARYDTANAQQHWREACVLLREMKSAGTLAPVDEKFLEVACRNAGMAD